MATLSTLKHIVAKNLHSPECYMSLLLKLNGKVVHMVRNKTQSVETTLTRISLNHKRQFNIEKMIPAVLVDSEGQSIDHTLSNVEAFTRATELRLSEEVFHVYQDPTYIKHLAMCRYPMENLQADFYMDIEGAAASQCHFKWYRVVKNEDILVCEEKEFFLSQSDVGNKIKMRCYPITADGLILEENFTEIVSKDVVLPYMGPFLFEYFQMDSLSSDQVRVVTYNILADYYTNTDMALNVMYPECSAFALNFDYRKRLLLLELEHYQADIIGLQECEFRLFEQTLYPALCEKYNGYVYTKKTNGNEGSALFFKKTRFEFITNYDADVSALLATDPSCESLRIALTEHDHTLELYNYALNQRSVLQVSLLHDIISHREVLAINTHLYFAPDADAVRLIQMTSIIMYINMISDSVRQSGIYKRNPAIILTGDYNSTPDSAAVELALTRCLKYNTNILPTPAELASAFTTNLFLFSATGFPKFSTYVSCFNGLLDYVFVDGENFELQSKCYGTPPDNLTLKHKFLPAPHTPSDHLALICDLKYKNNSFG